MLEYNDYCLYIFRAYTKCIMHLLNCPCVEIKTFYEPSKDVTSCMSSNTVTLGLFSISS